MASLVNSVSGAAITDAATVTLTAPDGGTAAASTTSGSITFTQVADAGGANPRVIKPNLSQTYSLSASADCHTSTQRTVLVPSAGNATTTQPVSIPMVRATGGSIAITFRKGANTGGAVIAGAPVTVQGGGPGLAAVTRTTDASGIARSAFRPPGDPVRARGRLGQLHRRGHAGRGQRQHPERHDDRARVHPPERGLLNSTVRLRLMDGTLYAQKTTLLGLTYADFHLVPPGSYRAAKQGLFGWGADTIVEVRSGEFRGPFAV